MRTMRKLKLLWCIAIVCSILSLLFFHSDETHGLDKVGSEVSGFVIPILIAIVVGIVMIFVGRKMDETYWDGPLAIIYSLTIGVVEIIIYINGVAPL